MLCGIDKIVQTILKMAFMNVIVDLTKGEK